MSLIEFLALLSRLKETCDIADRDAVIEANPDPLFHRAYDRYYVMVVEVVHTRDLDDAWPWIWSVYLIDEEEMPNDENI